LEVRTNGRVDTTSDSLPFFDISNQALCIRD
jgi:hypothetical protein